MNARNILLICLAGGSLALASGHDAYAGAKGATAPGTYRDWNGDIDEVTILQPFNAASFDAIAVESFDTSGVQLPNPRDNTYEAVRSAMRMIKPAFMNGVQENARRKATGGTSHSLIIRARLTRLDPGSRAARYWAGFGAGAVKIEMVGEIVDGASKKTLVRFRQERRSGYGVFGGGYDELFARTARQIGGDIAMLINAF